MFYTNILASHDESYIRTQIRSAVEGYISSTFSGRALVEHEYTIRQVLADIFWEELPTYENPIATWINLGCEDNAVDCGIYSDDYARSFADLMEESCNYIRLDIMHEEITNIIYG